MRDPRPLHDVFFDRLSDIEADLRRLRQLIGKSPVPSSVRPVASAVGAGTCWYDRGSSRPLWSDGTTWRDASGVEVP